MKRFQEGDLTMAVAERKTRKATKKRLALPAEWVKGLEEAKRNLHTYTDFGRKEVEKIYNRVIEIDFVKKVRKNDMVKMANKATKDFSKNVEPFLKEINRKVESQVKDLRHFLPLPTKTEVDRLSRKVNDLSKKIEEISSRSRRTGAEQ